MRFLKHRFDRTAAFRFPFALCICGFFFIFVLIVVLPPSPTWKMDDENVCSKKRAELYDKMAGDLEENGAKFLAGTTSQTLSISELFVFKDGNVQPVLKVAEPAVRAAVLYLEPQYAKPISATVKRILAPHFPRGVWFQDPNRYHFSMFHASHHLDPVVATPTEVAAEASKVEEVAKKCCELSIYLDRVVLTSTGVLLGCWQVLGGTEPAVIRRELQKTLPTAPAKQLYDEVILHTSFARLLGSPGADGKGSIDNSNYSVSVLHQLVANLSKELYHYEALVKELWFVEELDVLALALNGRINQHRFPLQCLKE